MDAKTFLAEFAHIANAPGGIEQLRQMIYQLAVTGALTPRSEKGEGADLLLEAVEVRRQGLIREKKYKRMVELEGEAVVAPFGIKLPSAWCWSRLLDVGEINPRNHADDDVKVAFLPMSGVPQLHRGGLVADTAKWGEIKKGYTHFARGDVVLAKITPCFENGKAAVIEGLPAGCVIGGGTTELHVFRPIHAGVLSEYVYLFLRSPLFAAEGVKNMTGTAGQKRLPTDFFATRAFPLPPAEEQAGIVAKVDELMALCDTLEAQQQARRKLQNNLRYSTLQAVATGRSPHELQIAWTRLTENFGQLFHAPEQVEMLRTVVLELAIRGELTEKLVSDGTASELLQKISQRNNEEVHSPRSKRSKYHREINDDQLPHVLPKNWAWVRLSDLGHFLGGGTPSKTNPEYWRGDIPWVSPKDMKVAYLNTTQDTISLQAVDESSVKLIAAGAILFVVRGMILAHSFPVGIASRELTINQDMKALCPFLPELSDFLFLLLSGSKRRFLGMVEKSTHGTCRLEAERLFSCVFGIPPLVEQHRIIARVAEISRHCDALESQLRSTQKCARDFSIAVVASLTGITIKKEDEPMKAPQTELIAPLRLGTSPNVKAQAPLATILVRHNSEMSAKDLWQRFGGEIDAFYAQLKTEVAHGWILEPSVAEMREKTTEDAGA